MAGTARTAAIALVAGWLADSCAASRSLAAGDDVPIAQVAQAEPAEADWQATASQIREIQKRLNTLGFSPGKPDGVPGPRTARAVKAYQRAMGLPVDGKISQALYDRLTAQAEPAVAPAVPEPAQPPEPTTKEAEPACPDTRETWQFEDSRGSSFKLVLKQDGSVDGPVYPEHWRWQPTDEGVEIIYDNGMGLTVTRRGHKQHEARMVGEATDTRGSSWSWSAVRLPASDEDEACDPGASP